MTYSLAMRRLIVDAKCSLAPCATFRPQAQRAETTCGFFLGDAGEVTRRVEDRTAVVHETVWWKLCQQMKMLRADGDVGEPDLVKLQRLGHGAADGQLLLPCENDRRILQQ